MQSHTLHAIPGIYHTSVPVPVLHAVTDPGGVLRVLKNPPSIQLCLCGTYTPSVMISSLSLTMCTGSFGSICTPYKFDYDFHDLKGSRYPKRIQS